MNLKMMMEKGMILALKKRKRRGKYIKKQHLEVMD